jgi:hypothetical protein
VRLRGPQRAVTGAKVRIFASVLDTGSGLAGRPHIVFGDGTHASGFHLAHRYKRAGRYVVTISATDRAGNTTLVRRSVRIRAAPTRSRRASHQG